MYFADIIAYNNKNITTTTTTTTITTTTTNNNNNNNNNNNCCCYSQPHEVTVAKTDHIVSIYKRNAILIDELLPQHCNHTVSALSSLTIQAVKALLNTAKTRAVEELSQRQHMQSADYQTKNTCSQRTIKPKTHAVRGLSNQKHMQSADYHTKNTCSQRTIKPKTHAVRGLSHQ